MRFPLSDKSRRPPIGEKSTGLKTAITGTIQFMSNITPELLALGFILYVVFLFSTTCHEAAHALAAKIGGDQTAFLGGQVTLNPVPHIQREPWGMVIIPILMLVMTGSLIGWASAPYDPNWARRHPHRYMDWLYGNSYGILGLVAAMFAFRYVYGPIEAFARDILLWSHF